MYFHNEFSAALSAMGGSFLALCCLFPSFTMGLGQNALLQLLTFPGLLCRGIPAAAFWGFGISLAQNSTVNDLRTDK